MNVQELISRLKREGFSRNSQEKLLKKKKNATPFNENRLGQYLLKEAIVTPMELGKAIESVFQEWQPTIISVPDNISGVYQLWQKPHTFVFQHLSEDRVYLSNVRSWEEKLIKPKNLVNALQRYEPDNQDIKDQVNERTIDCIHMYNPLELEKLFEDRYGQNTRTIFNTYTPPKHYFNQSNLEATIGPSIKKLLDHLFKGSEKDISYCIDWLATALKTRNICFLTLAGEQGIGKGVFCDLISSTFGEDNFIGGRQKDLGGSFNSHLANKQIINFNEINLGDDETMDTMKLFSETRLQIEGKGKDAVWQENFCNCIISTNRLDNLKINFHDRRFSVLQLTDLKLEFCEGIGAIDVFKSKLEKESGNFWKYLMEHDVKRSMGQRYFDPLTLNKIVYESAPNYEQILVNYIAAELVGHKVMVSEIRDSLSQEVNPAPGIVKTIDVLRKWKEIFNVGGGNSRDTIVEVLKSFNGESFNEEVKVIKEKEVKEVEEDEPITEYNQDAILQRYGVGTKQEKE